MQKNSAVLYNQNLPKCPHNSSWYMSLSSVVQFGKSKVCDLYFKQFSYYNLEVHKLLKNKENKTSVFVSTNLCFKSIINQNVRWLNVPVNNFWMTYN